MGEGCFCVRYVQRMWKPGWLGVKGLQENVFRTGPRVLWLIPFFAKLRFAHAHMAKQTLALGTKPVGGKDNSAKLTKRELAKKREEYVCSLTCAVADASSPDGTLKTVFMGNSLYRSIRIVQRVEWRLL